MAYEQWRCCICTARSHKINIKKSNQLHRTLMPQAISIWLSFSVWTSPKMDRFILIPETSTANIHYGLNIKVSLSISMAEMIGKMHSHEHLSKIQVLNPSSRQFPIRNDGRKSARLYATPTHCRLTRTLTLKYCDLIQM